MKARLGGLREIEHWLAEVDKRRQCSLPQTFGYFMITFLHTEKNPSIAGTVRTSLKLPSSLQSSDSCTFVSP
jgi:hypothetical protein